SRAHCDMLMRQKIISKKVGQAILQGLGQIEKEMDQGLFVFKEEYEDIHMNVEARLYELIGDNAGYLHTARSRNDQVVTDFKLWIRDHINLLNNQIKKLGITLLNHCENNLYTWIPGYTHFQPAQPISFAHHLMAYVEMLIRDQSRFIDCQQRLNECPLGAAALAGTSFPIDRYYTARVLGFQKPTANSIDTVSDRDFVLDFLASASILAMHLSRLAEEIVLWSTPQFGFITLSDSFSTGSSIMPQKRNPDAAELIRGKTSRSATSFSSLIMLMKALPLAYAKDLQEDKHYVFETYDTLNLCLMAMIGMLESMTVNKSAMGKATDIGFITATDLADKITQNLKLPFRQSYHLVGQLVKLAKSKKKKLQNLSLKELKSVHAALTKKDLDALTIDYSINSRQSYGGTAPICIKKSINEAYKKFNGKK
ncbi:MAG: argininosuccinate lyase, partial [Alphaproteobacteria bacterium]|nr:argininosuccinate lyase [Alphaproteobacteria bacterium]